MKIPSLILSSILCASLSGSLLAGVPEPAEPEKEKPPIIEKPAPSLQEKAYAAVEAGIVAVLRNYDESRRSFGSVFDRSLPIRIPAEFTITMVDKTPGKISATADRQPFKVLRTLRRPEKIVSPSLVASSLFSGYYDAKTQSVFLYHSAIQTYVLAAEHPVIEAKLALK